MDFKNQLTKTPYLVLFVVLISIGVGTASAAITITLAGNVHVLGDMVIDETLLIGTDNPNDDDGNRNNSDYGITSPVLKWTRLWDIPVWLQVNRVNSNRFLESLDLVFAPVCKLERKSTWNRLVGSALDYHTPRFRQLL